MPSPSHAAIAALLVLLCGAAGPGCGGGGDDVTALSQSDFAAEANRVCSQAQQQFDRIQRTSASTSEAVERQVAALIDVSRQSLDDLRRISPPAELQGGYERYLASRQRAIGFLEDARQAAADRDAPAYFEARRKVSDQLAVRLQLARAVGLRTCSRPSLTLGGGSG